MQTSQRCGAPSVFVDIAIMPGISLLATQQHSAAQHVWMRFWHAGVGSTAICLRLQDAIPCVLQDQEHGQKCDADVDQSSGPRG